MASPKSRSLSKGGPLEVTLKEYIESRMDEREKAHRSQLDNAERNLQLAADALREKLDGMNQFRHQIDAERALYTKRDDLDALVKLHNADIDRLSQRLEKLENWQANVTGRQIVFGGAVIIGSGTIAGVVIAVARMLGH